jgi:hypothetical protein
MKFKKKNFSETTEPISTKLCWNDSWVVLFQNCVRHFRTPTKMAATAERNLTYTCRTLWEIPIKIFLSETICWIRRKFWWNSHWMVLFQKCVRRFVEDFFLISSPLFSILSLAAILVGSRDHRTQFLKGAIQGSFHKSLVAIGPVVSEEKIFMWISLSWVVPFQNCVRQCRHVSKMSTITKNMNFFKWPKLLYFKPESAKIWTV